MDAHREQTCGWSRRDFLRLGLHGVTVSCLLPATGCPRASSSTASPRSSAASTLVTPRQDRFLAGDFASAPGDAVRCFHRVGCRGTQAKADCPQRLWQGRSYCIKANHPCIGCTSAGFLDARPTVDGRDVGVEGAATAPLYARRAVLP